MVDGSIVVCGRIGKASVGGTATEVVSWFMPVGTRVFVGVSVDKLGVQLVNKPVRRNNIWTCKICFFTFTSFWFDYAKNRPTARAERSGLPRPLQRVLGCVAPLHDGAPDRGMPQRICEVIDCSTIPSGQYGRIVTQSSASQALAAPASIRSREKPFRA